MAEVTAGLFSVPDLMVFETVNITSNITVTPDNMTTTDKQVSEGVVELEMETESVFKDEDENSDNDNDSTDSSNPYLSSKNENK